MILELTMQNLIDSGCNNKTANKLLNTIDVFTLQCNEGNYYVVKSENKFYTGIDFFRKIYLNNGELRFPASCPDLVPEYYDLALSVFINNQKEKLGVLFNLQKQTEKFILREIEQTNNIIKNTNEFISKMQRKIESKENLLNYCESYIDFLNEKIQQLKQPLPDTSKQKKDLSTQKWFKTGIELATGNAFEIYRKLKENKPTEICKQLGVDISNKTYISATINDTDTDKNIFKYTDKLNALHEYITKNKLNFGTEFLKKYNQIEPN